MPDKRKRCQWAGSNNLDVSYHDEEWGVPLHDDRLLFEFITLEGAQAGLSWSTILKKREGYRKAFVNFEPERILRFRAERRHRLLDNTDIVRNRLKVDSVFSNARAFLDVKKEFGTFDAYIWSFVGGRTIHNRWRTLHEIPAETDESRAMSKDLRKRGFRFVGPTICYAFMQATGMVNDHTIDCFRYREVKRAQ
jgi:DNA-3-methyladenine glycosylase I